MDATPSAGAEEIHLHPRISQLILGIAGSLAANPEKFSEEFVPQMFKRQQDAAFLKKLVTDSLKTPTSTAIAMLVTASFTIDRRPVLDKNTRPTLIICTNESSSAGSRAKIQARMPKTLVVVMEGVGHALFLHAPAEFNATPEDFLRNLNAR